MSYIVHGIQDFGEKIREICKGYNTQRTILALNRQVVLGIRGRLMYNLVRIVYLALYV